MLALMSVGLAHTPATGLEGLVGWFAWLLGGDSWRHVQLLRASVLRLQAQGWHLVATGDNTEALSKAGICYTCHSGRQTLTSAFGLSGDTQSAPLYSAEGCHFLTGSFV